MAKPKQRNNMPLKLVKAFSFEYSLTNARAFDLLLPHKMPSKAKGIWERLARVRYLAAKSNPPATSNAAPTNSMT